MTRWTSRLARSEPDVLAALRRFGAENKPRTSLVGMGYYPTVTPGVIQRNVLENPAWYTAYTPYQPEISQGRLEALLNFQTTITELTGLEVANASLLDEATAAAEAMSMARRLSKSPSAKFFVHHDTHPQTIAVLSTRAKPVGIELVVGDVDRLADGCFGALFSYPTSTGAIVDWRDHAAVVHDHGGLVVIATDLLACTLLTPPAQLGADIAVGSAQRFGVPIGFGGPHAAFISAHASAARAMPGRIVGVSTDTEGRPSLRLALQTREQHIRRERATSNICTAQVLLANIAGLYACWHGPEGLRGIAARVHRLASSLAAALRAGGLDVRHGSCFDTVTIDGVHADTVLAAAVERGIDLRRVSDDAVAVSFDETSTVDVLADVVASFGVTGSGLVDDEGALPRALARTGDLMTQSVFHRLRSEHEMLRYLRRLADRDLALDRTMIPLGSCTMKLNATTEMASITWPEFADLHPFAPADTSAGTRRMIAELEAWLAEITGYDAVSVQPNAGSQGEFAGLLAIRAYHRSRGDDERTVCLIPSSAHGTNAASAVMAGMDVVVVATDADGNVDVADLGAKLDRPRSPRGCDHGHLSLDTRCLRGTHRRNLQPRPRRRWTGLRRRRQPQRPRRARPAGHVRCGRQPPQPAQDVLHPARRRRPRSRPDRGPRPPRPVPSRRTARGLRPRGRAGVRRALRLCWDSRHPVGVHRPDGAGRAAPRHGRGDLLGQLRGHPPRRALPGAVHRRQGSRRPRVHHRPPPDHQVDGHHVDDVAKRLIDFGIHAPTMSFPVAGTLMIEPTESETLAELERFCQAMITIRGEIDNVADGTWPLEQSPLRYAPHTAEELIGEWSRPSPGSSVPTRWPRCGPPSTSLRFRGSTVLPVTAT